MRLAVTVLCVSLAAAGLFLAGTAGHALHNGDEAIYAEMAREMRASGDWGTLRWQGEPQFPRPPLAVWVLAAAGPDNLRLVNALVCGLEVGLLLALGWLWWGPAVGLAAAGLLAGCDLFLGYTRYFESEPLLCVMILASLIAWQRRQFVLWGVFLGLALMTKQVVGGLPLLAPLLDRRREAGRGLIGLLLVWAPWHIFAAVQHGWPFLDSYFVRNLYARTAAPMLHVTRWTFYFRELWRSEGPFALLFLGGAVWLLGQWQIGAGAAQLRLRLVAIWALGVLVVFTVARSRYDYYLLLAYPALALAAAVLLVRIHWALAVAVVAGMLALHAPRNLRHFQGEDEQRALVQLAHVPRLYLYNTHAYAARYYSDATVTTLLESDDDVRAARELQRAGMPSSVLAAADLPATLSTLPRPFALLMPRARMSLLVSSDLQRVGETDHYVLLQSR